ncbi:MULTISPECIES: DUF1330 domain-containing protein [unclassified Variovorax]|uniref:DUF1330 domain-containing protein n=1 Tax=unclassified Variovorax TaxID=663243 RepID=UPI001315F8DE|nr:MULTISPECIES: DUF1330 domain-containing protein [unclassified Variovorax]VTU23055.1 hypothetical protein SRS16CHR_03175 [Variovorax sp. SRS16]VTU31276.1 hypothetical protein E5CHR_03183 [Variovorax sp. PBL-E5]
MSSAYIIAHVDVTDPAQYEEYKKLSSEAMKAHGAEVCVRGGKVEVLEGDWNPQRIVILKFPSVEAAKKFNGSPEYAKARASRQGAAIMRMIVVEGL